jgi:hypothetical protein
VPGARNDQGTHPLTPTLPEPGKRAPPPAPGELRRPPRTSCVTTYAFRRESGCRFDQTFSPKLGRGCTTGPWVGDARAQFGSVPVLSDTSVISPSGGELRITDRRLRGRSDTRVPRHPGPGIVRPGSRRPIPDRWTCAPHTANSLLRFPASPGCAPPAIDVRGTDRRGALPVAWPYLPSEGRPANRQYGAESTAPMWSRSGI